MTTPAPAAQIFRARMLTVRQSVTAAITGIWANLFDAGDPLTSITRAGQAAATWVTAGQETAAREAVTYLTALESTLMGTPPGQAAGYSIPDGLIGTAHNGAPISALTGKAATQYLTTIDAGELPDVAERRALAQLNAIGQSEPYRAGNNTVIQNVETDDRWTGRYYRVTARDACDWCKYIADRGYTAAGVGFMAHRHCQCVPEPEPEYHLTDPRAMRYAQQQWQYPSRFVAQPVSERPVRPILGRLTEADLESMTESNAAFMRYLDRTYGDRLVLQNWDSDVRVNLQELNKVTEAEHQRIAAWLREQAATSPYTGKGAPGIYLGDGAIPGLDDLGYLGNEQPRGWPQGSTWRDVPGVYVGNKKLLAVGTGEHGSESIMLHELGHMADVVYSDAGLRASLGFDWTVTYSNVVEAARLEEAAHPEIIGHARINPYYLQRGGAGATEMWGEAYARYHLDKAAGTLDYLIDMTRTRDGAVAIRNYFDQLLAGT